MRRLGRRGSSRTEAGRGPSASAHDQVAWHRGDEHLAPHPKAALHRLFTSPLALCVLQACGQPRDGLLEDTHRRAGLLADVAAAGSSLTAADVAGYAVTRRAPVVSAYAGHPHMNAPPPSSGGTLLAFVLNVPQRVPAVVAGRRPSSLVAMVEALKYGFAARPALADPASALTVDAAVARLVDPPTAATVRRRLTNITYPPAHYVEGLPDGLLYGAPPTYRWLTGGAPPWPSHHRSTARFGPSPCPPLQGSCSKTRWATLRWRGRPPTRSACQWLPSSGWRWASARCRLLGPEGRAALVVGAGGGSRIISATLGAVLGAVAWGKDVAIAIAAQRAHHQLLQPALTQEAVAAATCALVEGGYAAPDEAPAVGEERRRLCEWLVAAGLEMADLSDVGQVQAVAVACGGVGELAVTTASDPRKLGSAAAYQLGAHRTIEVGGGLGAQGDAGRSFMPGCAPACGRSADETSARAQSIWQVSGHDLAGKRELS